MCLHVFTTFSCLHNELTKHPCDQCAFPHAIELCPFYGLREAGSSLRCSRDGSYCKQTTFGRWMEDMTQKLDQCEYDEYLTVPCPAVVEYLPWVLQYSIVRQLRSGNLNGNTFTVASRAHATIVQRAQQIVVHIRKTKQEIVASYIAHRQQQPVTNVNPYYAGHSYQPGVPVPCQQLSLENIAAHSGLPSTAHDISSASQRRHTCRNAHAQSTLSEQQTQSRAETGAQVYHSVPRLAITAPSTDPQPAARRSARTCAQKLITYNDDSSPEDSQENRDERSRVTEINEAAEEGSAIKENVEAIGTCPAVGSESPLSEAPVVSPPSPASKQLFAPAAKRAKLDLESPCQRFSSPTRTDEIRLPPYNTPVPAPRNEIGVDLNEHIKNQKTKEKKRSQRQRGKKGKARKKPEPELVDVSPFYELGGHTSFDTSNNTISTTGARGSFGSHTSLTDQLYKPDTIRMLHQERLNEANMNASMSTITPDAGLHDRLGNSHAAIDAPTSTLDSNAGLVYHDTTQSLNADSINHFATPMPAMSSLNTNVVTQSTHAGQHTFLSGIEQTAGFPAIDMQTATFAMPGHVMPAMITIAPPALAGPAFHPTLPAGAESDTWTALQPALHHQPFVQGWNNSNFIAPPYMPLAAPYNVPLFEQQAPPSEHLWPEY